MKNKIQSVNVHKRNIAKVRIAASKMATLLFKPHLKSGRNLPNRSKQFEKLFSGICF